MEQGSTSLFTSACNDYGESTLQPKHDVFLSHSGAQRKFVEELCVNLERCGLHPFFDEAYDCLVFSRLVFEAIQQSEVGVVVLSEEFFTSKWTMLELVAMTNVKKRKPSFTIKPILLGISLSQYHDVDNRERWLSRWHILAERDSRIDLKDWANALQWLSLWHITECHSTIDLQDWANALQSFGPKNALKYNIPRGAVYHRPNSNKFEPPIKFPMTRGVGGKSKRVPLGLYDTFAEGEVAYQIAAFYCKKRRHTGRLDLGGGASFPIPALSLDPSLPYEEKVKQVGDRVMKVYAEFEERKASRNLRPSVPRRALEMPTGDGQFSMSSPIQQLREPLNSGMDSAMQCQGFELGPNTHNRVDFNNPGSLLLLHTETQHELIGAYKQQEHLKAQVSRTEVENMGWEVKYSELDRKYSELERKYLELEQRNMQLEHENGLLNHQIMQSPLQTQHQEQEFDPDRFSQWGMKSRWRGDIAC